MRRFVLWLLKAGVSGFIAFTILTVFCILYYNVPVHDDTIDGATDYSWEHNKFYSRATEGFAWGQTNNEGYLNTFDYSKNQTIDILIMGSSHMEAYQVAMHESTASVLGNLLPDHTVYNIGVSGHNFLVCADNFTAAIDKYKPSKYVVLEMSNLLYTDEQLTTAINEAVPDLSSHASGVIGTLQKNQFLRLLYTQLEAFNDNLEFSDNSDIVIPTTNRGSEKLYDELLEKLSNTASQSGAQLIIVYHPHLKINQDGSASALIDGELAVFFEDVCKRNNISFLNMSSHFVRCYEEAHILPHGFSNTSVGSGHLNKNGHEMIADAVYKLIKEAE